MHNAQVFLKLVRLLPKKGPSKVCYDQSERVKEGWTFHMKVNTMYKFKCICIPLSSSCYFSI